MSSKKGKLVYLSIPAIKGLEELGRRYIHRDFDKMDRVSYNRACLFLLKIVKLGEQTWKEQQKLSQKLNDENDKEEE